MCAHRPSEEWYRLVSISNFELSEKTAAILKIAGINRALSHALSECR